MDTLPIQLPERQSNYVTDDRRARKIARTNRSPISKGILVNPGEDIQAAIDAIEKDGGGIITLVGGTYYPKGNITMKANCRLVGENSITTIIDFNNQAYSIIYPDITTAGQAATNMQTERIQVKNSTTHGIVVEEDAENVYFKHVDSRSNGGDGFKANPVQGLFFENCNAISNAGNGFSLDEAIRVEFIGANTAQSNTLTGLLISGSSYVLVYDFLAISNIVDGIRMEFSSISCRLYSPICIGNGRYGINLVTVNWNNIHDAIIQSNTSDGIRIDTNANRNRIVNSTIISNGGWGVLINNANCDNNLLAFDDLGSVANTSGTLSDAGTGTVSVNHIT